MHKHTPWSNGIHHSSWEYLISATYCTLAHNKINIQEEGASLKSEGVEENILGGEERIELPVPISMRIWHVKEPPGIWGECFLKKNSIGFRLSKWLLSSKHPLLTLIDFYRGIQLLLKITSIISSWLYE